MILQQNYFGSYTHFQTGERLDDQVGHGDPVEEKYRPGHVCFQEFTIYWTLTIVSQTTWRFF
jgi:hypothetical protein